MVAGPLRIHPDTRSAALGDHPLALTPTEFDLLLALARGKGRVRSRDQLYEDLRGGEWEAFDRAIDMHVSVLRKKLGDDPKSPRFIKTIRGVGYMLSPPDPGT
ncbi:MAG: winged helix-turn-helix domain-containing protein [Kiritimatiellia bacterium]